MRYQKITTPRGQGAFDVKPSPEKRKANPGFPRPFQVDSFDGGTCRASFKKVDVAVRVRNFRKWQSRAQEQGPEGLGVIQYGVG